MATASLHASILPPRLAFLTWDEGDIGFAGSVQTAHTDSYRLWLAIVSPAGRDPATIAKLIALLLVDGAEQVLHPFFLPAGMGTASLLRSGAWRIARGRTLPSWAEAEVLRIASIIEREHASFLKGAADALNGALSSGFYRPGPDFIIQDDTGHTIVADTVPMVPVDLAGSGRRGKKWYEIVRSDYRRDRVLRHLTDEQLGRRLSEIVANVTVTTNQGLVGCLPPGDDLLCWMSLFTEAVEEMELRHGPYPAGLASGRVKVGNMPASLDPRNLGRPRKLTTRRKSDAFVVKYGQKRYLEPLLSTGALRISPASSYGDASLNVAIRDDELVAELDISVDALPPVFPLVREAPPGARLKATKRLGTNFYVLCTSLCTLEPRLLADFGGDSCLVVHDLSVFTARLEAALQRILPDWMAKHGEVRYYDPLGVVPSQVELPLWKHFRYAYQHEYRFSWLPPRPEKELRPVNVDLGCLEDIAELVVPSG